MLRPAATTNSGSSWLNRLRIAKGFPENDATNLEHFLQNPNSPNTESPDPNPNPNTGRGPDPDEDQEMFNVMSNVLNELFNFGDCYEIHKKSARKQGNPRICAFSNNSSGENNNDNNAVTEKATVLRSGDNNSGVEGVKELDERENENGDGSLSGFSRTEVTVIDTSYECWKFDKLLYRKKNVWKVRDRKGKSESVGRKKKRKLAEEEGRGVGKKRKAGESEGRGKQCEFLLNEDYHQSSIPLGPENATDKVSSVRKKKQEDL